MNLTFTACFETNQISPAEEPILHPLFFHCSLRTPFFTLPRPSLIPHLVQPSPFCRLAHPSLPTRRTKERFRPSFKHFSTVLTNFFCHSFHPSFPFKFDDPYPSADSLFYFPTPSMLVQHPHGSETRFSQTLYLPSPL